MSVKSKASSSQFVYGLLILLAAQLMAAYMGAFMEDTYSTYKASWTENMFYSHLLGLPFFLPFGKQLRSQYSSLAATEQLQLCQPHASKMGSASLPATACAAIESLPRGLAFLLMNAATQLVCIAGVNMLSAKSSAVTVTIVLNIRKLVSFIASTLVFGHTLSTKMMLGSALVFSSGALYGWETSWRIPRQKAERQQKNVAKHKST